MSIIHAAVKLIIREHAHYKYDAPVISLGIPEIYANAGELAKWFPEFTGQPSQLKPEDVQISDNKHGKLLNWVTADCFAKAFGFDGMDSLDIPGSEHRAAIVHDLNDPVPENMRGKYGLLLDPGTLEHIFDQKTCMETITALLRVGGVAINFVPIYSYNGGYYSINPNVLCDYYAANGFEDIRAYILMWDRYWPYSKKKIRCYTYRSDILGARHALADFDQVRYTPHLLIFARKARELDKTVIPLQFGGNYEGPVTSESRTQALESRGKRLAALAQRYLPLEFAMFLAQVAYRRLTLWRARRRASFWI